MSTTPLATHDAAALAFACALLPLYPIDVAAKEIAARAHLLAAALLSAGDPRRGPGRDSTVGAPPPRALLLGWAELCRDTDRPDGISAHDAIRAPGDNC